MKKVVKKSSICILFLLFTLSVIAIDTVKMDEYVVTPSKFDNELLNTSVKVEIIDSKTLESSSVTNAADVIGKYICGHYHKYNGGISQSGIRGFRTDADDSGSHVLVLIDGHKIGTANLSKIPLERIERIEIVKGPVSSLYGSSAMGGVINIITKKGAESNSFVLKQEFGSFSFQNTALESNIMFNDKVSINSAASYNKTDDYKEPTFGKVYNSAEEKLTIGANLYIKFSDIKNLRIGGSYIDYEAKYPSWDNWMTYSQYKKEISDYSDKDNGYFDVEYNDALTENSKQKFLSYYSYDENSYFYGYPIKNNTYDKSKTNEYGIEFANEWTFSDNHLITLGAAYETVDKKSSSKRYGYRARPYLPDMEYDILALYIQDGINFFDEKINLIFGGRFDSFNEKTENPTFGSFISFREKEEKFEEFSPKAGIVFNMFDGTVKIKANAGQGFKAPTAEQLSAEYEYFDWGTEYRFLGNSNLSPEKSVTYDFGVDFTFGYFQCGLNYFHTNWKDKIQESRNTVLYNNKYWRTWENIGDAVIEGFEGDFKIVLGKWNIAVNTLYNSNYKDKEERTYLYYISEYEIKSRLSYEGEKFQFGIDYIIIGPQNIQNWDSWVALTEEKSSFNFVDLNCSYKLSDKYSLTFNILNVFDETYEWVRGYIMPERNYKAGFKWKFG